MSSGDTYKRREVRPGVYQCGCYWTRLTPYGDMLSQCALHQQATDASVKRFDRERGARK